MTENIVDIEHATSCTGGLEILKIGTESSEATKAGLLLTDPQGGIVNKFATCGRAVVQVDVDRGSTPTYGVGAVTLVVLEVQRTIKRAEALWGRGDFLRRQKGGAGLKEAALLTSVLATKMLISGTRLMTALTKDSL